MNPTEDSRPTQPASVARSMPAGRFVVVWAAVWAIVGIAVAGGIVFMTAIDRWPALRLSILFAEVVGFTALVSARLIFPLFNRLPYALRLLAQGLTLLSGTVFGSVAVIAFQPLFSLAQIRTVGLIVLVNAVIAVIAGTALHTYDSLRRQLEHSFEALRHKEALDRELSIARDVQQRLLPMTAPEIRGLELAGICRPAVDVGGDYFDFLQVGEQDIGLVIADISGKGIPAALLMAGLHAAVRSLVRPAVAPAELAERLNEILFHSSSAARYATMFVGFYDGVTRRLTYANAGHHAPVLLRNGSAELLPATGGFPIGMFEGSTYAEQSRQLESGDLLALFTDGVTEAPNPRGEEFGEQRLIHLVQRHGDEPLNTIVRRVVEALGAWSSGDRQFDDVTLVLARVS